MLVRLTSNTSGEIIMFAEHLHTLFQIIGKECTPRGVFLAEQLPDAIAKLHKAVDEEKQELHEAERQAQRQREQAIAAAATQTPTQAYARSPECARSRRSFDLAASSTSSTRYGQNTRLQAAQRQMELDCLGPEGYAALERSRPAPQPQPIVVYPPQRWQPYPHRPRPPRPPRPPYPPPPEHPARPPGAQ